MVLWSQRPSSKLRDRRMPKIKKCGTSRSWNPAVFYFCARGHSRASLLPIKSSSTVNQLSLYPFSLVLRYPFLDSLLARIPLILKFSSLSFSIQRTLTTWWYCAPSGPSSIRNYLTHHHSMSADHIATGKGVFCAAKDWSSRRCKWPCLLCRDTANHS